MLRADRQPAIAECRRILANRPFMHLGAIAGGVPALQVPPVPARHPIPRKVWPGLDRGRRPRRPGIPALPRRPPQVRPRQIIWRDRDTCHPSPRRSKASQSDKSPLANSPGPHQVTVGTRRTMPDGSLSTILVDVLFVSLAPTMCRSFSSCPDRLTLTTPGETGRGVSKYASQRSSTGLARFQRYLHDPDSSGAAISMPSRWNSASIEVLITSPPDAAPDSFNRR